MNEASPPKGSLASLKTAELVETYLKSKEDAGRSSCTIYRYQLLLRSLARQHPHLPLDPDLLQGFIKGEIEYAPETHIGHFGTVRAFYNWLVRRKVLPVDQNPFPIMDRPPKNMSPARRFLSLEQLRKVVEVSVAPLERALILTLIDSGPRIGEVTNCTKNDLVDGMLSVYGKEGGHIVPLDPEVYEYLQELPTHNLFPKLERSPIGAYEPQSLPSQILQINGLAHSIHFVQGQVGSQGTNPPLPGSIQGAAARRFPGLDVVKSVIGPPVRHQEQ